MREVGVLGNMNCLKCKRKKLSFNQNIEVANDNYNPEIPAFPGEEN